MTGVKRIKRRRGRPVVGLDDLWVLFHGIEGEMARTGFSARHVCKLIIKKHGPFVFTCPETGAKTIIKNPETLRSRYAEVLAALSPASIPDLEKSFDDFYLVRDGRAVRKVDTLPMVRPGEKILGEWGPTKKSLRARRQASLARRQTKLHNK